VQKPVRRSATWLNGKAASCCTSRPSRPRMESGTSVLRPTGSRNTSTMPASDMVVYTGTHDNPPVRAWIERYASAAEKGRFVRYVGRESPAGELPEFFIRLAMMSAARIAIIPFQDLLGLGNEARMNTPGTEHGNWGWRLTEGQLTEAGAEHLRDMTGGYGRAPTP